MFYTIHLSVNGKRVYIYNTNIDLCLSAVDQLRKDGFSVDSMHIYPQKKKSAYYRINSVKTKLSDFDF